MSQEEEKTVKENLFSILERDGEFNSVRRGLHIKKIGEIYYELNSKSIHPSEIMNKVKKKYTKDDYKELIEKIEKTAL